MKKRSGLFLALAMGVVGSLGYTAVDATTSMLKAEPTRAAVIDMQKVLTGLEENKKIQATLNARISTLRKEVSVMQADAKDRKNSLENVYKQGTAQYDKAYDELTDLMYKIDSTGKIGQAKAVRYQLADVKVLYAKVISNVETLAKREGYDLVLQTANYDNLPSKGEAFNAMLGVRRVLYSVDSIDLTDAIISSMNAKFKSGQ